MTPPVLTLSRLVSTRCSRSPSSSTSQLLQQLYNRGFACITVDEPDTLRHLRLASPEAKELSGFRFPPMEEGVAIVWNERQRLIVRSLFRVATTCLGALLTRTIPNTASDRLVQILKDAERNPPFIFNEHEPFLPSQPFQSSFFNLFNYKNGLLNPHVDRSLVTVIYSSPPPPPSQLKARSSLWIKDRHGTWRDGDRAAAEDNQVVLLIGEEFQEAGLVLADDDDNNRLYPALHAVKVDPRGENLARPHYRPDPAQELNSHVEARTSAALILRHDFEQ